jgi:predicted DNA-binding transcriptional regulator AlpA
MQKRSETMLEVIQKYMKLKGVSMSGLSMLLGISPPTMWRWYAGQQFPGGRYISQWYCSDTWTHQFAIDMMEAIKAANGTITER